MSPPASQGLLSFNCQDFFPKKLSPIQWSGNTMAGDSLGEKTKKDKTEYTADIAG